MNQYQTPDAYKKNYFSGNICDKNKNDNKKRERYNWLVYFKIILMQIRSVRG